MIGQIVYILCALTSLFCTVLLLTHYRRTKVQLLFWSGIAFLFFTANNILLFVDLILVPQTDLSILRTGCALAGAALLLYSLIKQNT